MPRIGIRMIKTAISVFICLLIFVLVLAINYAVTNSFEGATKWYTPFFASLAAAYSIATTKQLSFKQAKTRIVASIVGGLVGIAVVFLYTTIFKTDWPFSGIDSIGVLKGELDGYSYVLSYIVPSILVSLSVVAVIYICVLIKERQASFVSVLTLTAVMCSLGTNPIQYGFTRILSTIIGVLVALGVNLFHIPFYKNKKMLFLLSMDGYHLDDNYILDGYDKFTISTLSYHGANISILSTRTPTTLIPMLDGIEINCPVMCMSGAALYDIKTKKYLYEEKIDKEIAYKIRQKLDELKITPLINFIEADVLYSYCSNVDNIAMNTMVEFKRNSAYSCFVPHEAPDKDVLYFVIVVEKDRTEELINNLKSSEFKDDILLLKYDFDEIFGSNSGYNIIKIFSKKLDDLNSMKVLCGNNDYTKIGVLSHDNDYHIIDNMDYNITTKQASDAVKESCNEVINNVKLEASLRKVKRLFHKKNIKE